MLCGLIGAVLAYQLAPALLPWLAPVVIPMLLAPAIISWSSRPANPAAFTIPSEQAQPNILTRDAGFRT
ncbi:hypothetical protein RZS08_67500, partial [Arthrospira platensis SPKY1]|nr:hypothetical protein [Arthrospira platensis SPKY1]